MRNLSDIRREAANAVRDGEWGNRYGIQPQAADILALCDEVERLRKWADAARYELECVEAAANNQMLDAATLLRWCPVPSREDGGLEP